MALRSPVVIPMQPLGTLPLTVGPSVASSLSSLSANSENGAFGIDCTPATTITVPYSTSLKVITSTSSTKPAGSQPDVSSWLTKVQEASEPQSRLHTSRSASIISRFQELTTGGHRHNLISSCHPTPGAGIRKMLFSRKLKVSNTRLVEHVTPDSHSSSHPCDSDYLYGRCLPIEKKIGCGTFGTVYLVSTEEPVWNQRLHVFKVLKPKSKETEKDFKKRATVEFLFGNRVSHTNVLRTLDLVDLKCGNRCHVMPYCGGGDLYSLIESSGTLKVAEADCFFKQLLLGVEYLHSIGFVHRDIKPENLLLTDSGVLKIADFDTCEMFSSDSFVKGKFGSVPYLSPELCFAPGVIKGTTLDGYYPPALDVWACGIVYLAMRYGHLLWWCANAVNDATTCRGKSSPPRHRNMNETVFDPAYKEYIEGRQTDEGFAPIQNLGPPSCHNLLYCILDPNPLRRLSAPQAVKSQWISRVSICSDYGRCK